MSNLNAYRCFVGSIVVLVLMATGRLAGQELPQPLTREAGEELPPQAVVHQQFLKGIAANRELFDRRFCEGEYEIRSSEGAEPTKGRFRCWHYFREGEGPRPTRRHLRLETEGEYRGVWVVGQSKIHLLYNGVMKVTDYSSRDAIRPIGVGMPSPPLVLMDPPGGFGTVTYHRSLGNPTIDRSSSQEGDVLTLVHEEHSPRGTDATRWGNRQTCRFRIQDERWLPIGCEECRLRGGKVLEPPGGGGGVRYEMTYREGVPVQLKSMRRASGGSTIYRFERWERTEEWDESLFADVTRSGWDDPRKDGLVLYELTRVELEDKSYAPAWQVSEFKEGKFHPLCKQWVGMTQVWRPHLEGIEAGVEVLLKALPSEKPERLIICQLGMVSPDNQDLQDFLEAVGEALDERQIPHEQGTPRAFQTLRRLHRLTYAAHECYDGTVVQWNLFEPGSLRTSAAASIWVSHPGHVPEGGEVTPMGPPGALGREHPRAAENLWMKPAKQEMERRQPGRPLSPRP